MQPLRRHLCRLTLMLLILPLPILAAADSIPAPLTASLSRAGIPGGAVAVLVRDLEASTPLVAHRVDEALNPASVMKLVSSFAALEQLGPTFTWRTRIYGDGPLRNGVLQGNLIVVGDGDPRLSRERLWLLLRDLRGQIRQIDGDVIFDRSHFHLPSHDPGRFDGRPLRPYNVGADALLVDYGAVRIRITPGSADIRAELDPLTRGLVLENHLRTEDSGPCGDPSDKLIAEVNDSGSTATLILNGKLPRSCTERFDWNLAPLPPARHFDAVFRGLWQELGGEVKGRFADGTLPAGARLLAESLSPTLPEVLRDMNKWSNNLIARNLLATLGALAEPGQDSVAAGARMARQTLADRGIATDGLVIENGAGLSRNERISARTLGELLLAAWRSPTMPEFMASLPIAGRDGTARRRLANSPAAGFAHVKTGTLDGVRTLAGYVLGKSGHRYAVVLLINHPSAAAARDAQDALLEWAAAR